MSQEHPHNRWFVFTMFLFKLRIIGQIADRLAPGSDQRDFQSQQSTVGIDDLSRPGLWTLIADYFGPTRRGNIYGFLDLHNNPVKSARNRVFVVQSNRRAQFRSSDCF
jgi:hypothetical protein